MVGAITTLIKRVIGSVADGATDDGYPVGVGSKTVELAADPTEHAAGDRSSLLSTRQGILWVLAGMPNILNAQAQISTSTTTALIAATASERIVVTSLLTTADNANGGDQKVAWKWASGSPWCRQQGVAPGAGYAWGNGGGVISVSGVNEALNIDTDAAEIVDVQCTYFKVPSS